MRKDDQYNKMILESIVSGTPISAKKAKELVQSGLSESQIQQSCIRWFQYVYPQLWKDGVLFHVANERKCTQWQGKKLKMEGVVKGVADLCLSISRHGYNALFIEMKKPGGYQSKEQKEWQSGIEKHGNKYVVCKSLEEFEWISSPEAVSLYIYLLLTASSGENMIFGNQVHRGQVLTLRSSLMRELGISSQKITTAIRRLIDADCISLDKIRKYYLITLKRYDDYSAIPK